MLCIVYSTLCHCNDWDILVSHMLEISLVVPTEVIIRAPLLHRPFGGDGHLYQHVSAIFILYALHLYLWLLTDMMAKAMPSAGLQLIAWPYTATTTERHQGSLRKTPIGAFVRLRSDSHVFISPSCNNSRFSDSTLYCLQWFPPTSRYVPETNMVQYINKYELQMRHNGWATSNVTGVKTYQVWI